MPHPVGKVKTLVGALAHAHGITVDYTYSCVGRIIGDEREYLMASTLVRFRLSHDQSTASTARPSARSMLPETPAASSSEN